MPRKRHDAKERRYVMNVEVLCVEANCGAGGDVEPWERYWGGTAEGRAAFEALRTHLRPESASYEDWQRRLKAESRRY